MILILQKFPLKPGYKINNIKKPLILCTGEQLFISFLSGQQSTDPAGNSEIKTYGVFMLIPARIQVSSVFVSKKTNFY